jgi:hypothetical protein
LKAIHLGWALCAALAVGCGGSGGPPDSGPIPVLDTLRRIEGEIRYLTTGPDLSQFDASGRLLATPGFSLPNIGRAAPRFPIQILSLSGSVIGSGITDASGRYSITANFGKAPATQVLLNVVAQISFSGGPIVRVLPGAGGTVYRFQSTPLGNPNDNVMRIDLTVPLTSGGPLYILEALYDAVLAVKSGITGTMPNIDVLYAPGNGAVSSVTAGANGATMVVAGGITGVPTSNQDVWDPPVVARLLGEYLFLYFLNDGAPGPAAGHAAAIPSSAWREGFLDFISCAGRGSTEFWDTTGIGADGRVVRYFDIESFFDPALGSLGPNDPNVYQGPADVGVTSRFTVAEMLWDIFDGQNIPLFLTIRALRTSPVAFPYLLTLLDGYVEDGTLTPTAILFLTRILEDQGFDYPVPAAAPETWPAFLGTPAGQALVPPIDYTVSDALDNVSVDPVTGVTATRYFRFELDDPATSTVTLTTTGTFAVELLDTTGALVVSGTNGIPGTLLQEGLYYVRVRSATPQAAAFDLRLIANP